MNKAERVKKLALQKALYALMQKQPLTYGEYYKITKGESDYTKGVNTLTRNVHNVKMITYDITQLHKFEYDIGYLAANKNFTYGGFYEPGDRVVIIEKRMQLQGINIELKDYFVIDNKRYDIQKLDVLDCDVGWIVHLRNIPSTKTERIINVVVFQRITPTQEIENDTI